MKIFINAYFNLILCCSLLYTDKLHAKPDTTELYSIQVIQGRDTFFISADSQNTIYLNRQPFQFKFHLQLEKYVYLIASRSDRYFNTPAKREFPDCLMFCNGSAGAVGADVPFNPDRDLCIYGFSQGITCWYFDSAADHRFDPETISGDSIKGFSVSRTIENMYDYNVAKSIPIRKIPSGTQYYIVFFNAQKEICDQCTDEVTGLPWRRYVTLIFR